MKRHTTIAIICVIAAITGYLLALPRAVDAASQGSTTGHQAHAGIPDREPTDATKRKSRSKAELDALQTSLLARFRESPNAWNDWPLRRQTAALLSDLSPDELRDLAMSLHDPEKKTRDLPMDPGDRATLLSEILLQWSLRDPEGAIACQAMHSISARTSLFADWKARAPEEANAWLFSADHPEDLKKVVENLRFSEIAALASTDFDAALSQWDHVTPDQQRMLVSSWGKILLKDPSKRQQTLDKIALLADRDLAFWCYQNLVRSLADAAPAEAASLVSKMDVDDTQRTKLNDSVLGGWMRKEPAAALDHWVGLGQDKLPREVAAGFGDWLILGKSMEAAATWFAKVPDGPARTALEKEAVSNYLHFDFHSRAAEVSLNMTDPELRAEQLNIVHHRWLEEHPESAKKWAEGLSENDRALLTK